MNATDSPLWASIQICTYQRSAQKLIPFAVRWKEVKCKVCLPFILSVPGTALCITAESLVT